MTVRAALDVQLRRARGDFSKTKNQDPTDEPAFGFALRGKARIKYAEQSGTFTATDLKSEND